MSADATEIRVKEPLIFELSSPGRTGYSLPELDVPAEPLEQLIPEDMLRREDPALPEVSEVDVVRHFVRLSQMNHGVDTGFYPLGSCTMKYSPKINEDVARLGGFAALHPCQPEETVQGALQLMYETGEYLKEIAGLPHMTLQPAAGAHGEITGLMLIRAYHRARGEKQRDRIIIPDTAHGTNPASAVMAGFTTVEVPSDENGDVDTDALTEILDDRVAGLMLTNPSTLGLYDVNIHQIAEMVHDCGGLLYYDGANANAIMGLSRPGDMGFDIVHFNLHKTFSTPHGGGGPGSGPIAVREDLAPYLPVPVVRCEGETYRLDYDLPESIGPVLSFYGNFGVVVKAYAYIRSLGAEGLKAVSEDAVLNANYLMGALKDDYYLTFDRSCMHEFVLSSKNLKREHGVSTLDVAKALLDRGLHPPTIYFPLIVDEALMIEPTETESKQSLDAFIQAMKEIAREAASNPEALHEAPTTTPVRRLDEVTASRRPVVRWHPGDEEDG
ncbi:MAG: aminomethyl-transferring glycine dehydrogenase subunit GcvPB [Bacillota bacterium]